MPTSHSAVSITTGIGANVAIVTPGTNNYGVQQVISIGDPNDGNQQMAVINGAGSFTALDGSLITIGNTGDASWNGSTANPTLISIQKSIRALLAGNLAIGGSVSVSNFPATQPISAVSLPLPTGAATAAKQPALGTAGTPSADVISIQGVASGIVVPISGTVIASQGGGNWTQNLVQLAGTAIDVNSGAKSAGTIRAVLATDQPALTNFFPAAAALGDADANPNTVRVGAAQQLWDGSVWKRWLAASAADVSSGHAIAGVAPLISAAGTFYAIEAFADGDAHDGMRYPGVGLMVWNGSSADRVRPLSSSGFGLGALLVAGAPNKLSLAATQLPDTNLDLLLTTNDVGVTHRAWYFNLAGNKQYTVHIAFQSPNQVSSNLWYHATIDAAVTASYMLSAATGMIAYDGGKNGVTGESSTYAMLDVPAYTMAVYAQASSLPGTSDKISVDYIGICS